MKYRNAIWIAVMIGGLYLCGCSCSPALVLDEPAVYEEPTLYQEPQAQMVEEPVVQAAPVVEEAVEPAAEVETEMVAVQPQVAQPQPQIDYQKVNKKIIDIYTDLQIQNAIITQHTLYPYHFVNNSAQLNTLGERDLSVLIAHFQENPGKLSLQQGNTSAQLYRSRLQTVYEKMLLGGVEEGKIRLVKEMPGGEGIASTTMIEILEKQATTRGQGTTMDVQF